MRRVFDWMYSFSSITYMLMGTPLTSLEQFPITISEDASRLSSSVKVAELCPTLCDPMHCIVRGILQARTLEWVAFPFSRGSSQSRDWTQVSRIAGGFFTSWATGEALISPQIKLQFTSLTSLTWYIFISVDTLGWEKFLNTEDTYLFCCIFFFFFDCLAVCLQDFSSPTRNWTQALWKRICQCRRRKRRGFNLGFKKIPWSTKWQLTTVFLPRKFHGQRSLAGYSPWDRRELDTTEWPSTHIQKLWQWKHRVLTTRPLGNSLAGCFYTHLFSKKLNNVFF